MPSASHSIFNQGEGLDPSVELLSGLSLRYPKSDLKLLDGDHHQQLRSSGKNAILKE